MESQRPTRAMLLQPVLAKGVPSLLGHYSLSRQLQPRLLQLRSQHRTRMGKCCAQTSAISFAPFGFFKTVFIKNGPYLANQEGNSAHTHIFKAINNLKILVAFILGSSYIIQSTMVLRNIERQFLVTKLHVSYWNLARQPTQGNQKSEMY